MLLSFALFFANFMGGWKNYQKLIIGGLEKTENFISLGMGEVGF